MPFICLPKQFADKFINGLRDGRIDPAKLAKMTSAERREYLAKFVGEENAKAVNSLFESKLLLKNQQRGMITWAKKIAQLSPEARRDALAKIEKLEKALTPESEEAFLADITETRLGVRINAEGANKIMSFTNKMDELWETAKTKLDGLPPTEENIKEVLRQGDKEYFRTYKELLDFMAEKRPVYFNTKMSRFYSNFAEGISVARAIKTGLDLSAALRQGGAYFGRGEWFNAFARMFGYAKNKNNLAELEVEMLSHKYADIALKYKRDLGLTILGETFTQREEAFAAKFIEKIPLLKVSERAYTGFLNDLRFNRFVNVLENLKNAGQDITDNPDTLKALAQTIAGGSGRGNLAKMEGAAEALSTALFSPRWVASRLRLITDPFTKSGVARQEAIKNLATVLGIASGVLGAYKLAGGDVETDLRSSDFGKMKIGNVRFDITAGLAPYLRVMAQMITTSTKSSTTGKITKLNTGEFGARTSLDILIGFIENKASPLFGIFRDLMKGEQFGGEKLEFDFEGFLNNPKKFIENKENRDSAAYIANQLITPLIVSQTIEVFNESSGASRWWITSGAIAGELLGLNVNAYSYAPSGKKWDMLKEQYGDDEYNRVIKELNINLAPRLEKLQQGEKYQSLSLEEQNAAVDTLLNEEKEKILKNYKFKEEKKETISGKKILKELEN